MEHTDGKTKAIGQPDAFEANIYVDLRLPSPLEDQRKKKKKSRKLVIK
jgi:hypothetical protein